MGGHPAHPAGAVGGRRQSAAVVRVLAATVAVKIRDTDFVTITRQKTLADPTDSTDVIWRAAIDLTRREVKGMRVRLAGRGGHAG